MKKLSIFFSILTIMTIMFSGCGKTPPTESKKPFDYSSLPFYDGQAAEKTYEFNDELAARPFWLGNVMYNESVMFIKNDNGLAEATPLFKPIKVLSVRDYTLKKEYKEGVDYEVTTEGKIIALSDGEIPVFDDGWQYGINMPNDYTQVFDMNVTGKNYHVFDCVREDGSSVGVVYTEGSLFYGNSLSVTYAYDPAQFDYAAAKSYSNELGELTQKLLNGENIKMLIFGDSISEGCSSSKHWNREPYAPFYGEIVKAELERVYDAKIEYENYSLGGMTSKWGAGLETANNGGYNPSKIKQFAPDLIIIGFGANDAGVVSSEDYSANIKIIADNARQANPNCSIIFLNSYPCQENFTSRNSQKKLRDVLEAAAFEYDNATFIDMYSLGLKMLEVKKHYEITNNGVNHPNDFMHRVYAMNILSSIVDYRGD